MTGLLDGPYAVEVWTTLGGRRRMSRRLTAVDGKLSIALPEFRWDLAVKVKFLGAKLPSVQSTAGWSPAVKKTPAGK